MSSFRSLKPRIYNLHFSTKTVPWAILALAAAAFGILLPGLGLYWDDWETILVLRLYPLSEINQYFAGHRPLAGWTYLLFAPIVGVNPLNWQIFALALRVLTVVTFWWAFSMVWPARKSGITLAAFLFMVYPVFLEQPIAVSFHQHWLAYLLFMLSLGCMLVAARNPRRYLLLTAAGLVAQCLHMITLEYFLGVELLRPLLLWFSRPAADLTGKKKWRWVIKNWAPYLLLLAGFVIFRMSLSSTLTEDPNRPRLLLSFFAQPIASLTRMGTIALQDLAFVSDTSWLKTMPPAYLDLNSRTNLLMLGAAFIVALCLWQYFVRLNFQEDPQSEPKRGLLKDGFLVTSGIAVILGLLPIWVTSRQASAPGLYTDRFALPAMFGMSLFIVAFLDWLSPDRIKKSLLVFTLIALAVNTHLHVGNNYRWSWTEQKRTYWQLYWRAPYILPETVLLTDTELFSYVFPMFSFNLLYNNPPNPERGAYVFSYIGKDFVTDRNRGETAKTIDSSYRNFKFHASGLNSIILFNGIAQGANCLWVLDQQDQDNPYLPESIRSALPLANDSRILPDPLSDDYPDQAIFGPELEHGWCYYYQKGELAHQQQDWSEATRLADEAQKSGFTPDVSQTNSPQEWMAFIESYAYVGRWEDAESITLTSYRVDQNYRQALCGLWDRIHQNAADHESSNSSYLKITDELACLN